MARLRLRPTLLTVLASWLGILGFAAHMLISSEIGQLQRGFDETVRDFVSELRHKLDTNEVVLAGLSAFLQAVERGDTASTTRYAASIVSAYPHIYMLEVARQVGVAEQSKLEASLRRSWRNDFAIKDFSAITGRPFQGDAEKTVTWPILFMYPALPEAKSIYGVRLETVDYLSHALALAKGNKKPVASPAFSMYEGGSAYILFQEVSRDPGSGKGDLDFFGNTMMAIMLIKTDALIPVGSLNDRGPTSVSAVLNAAANPESLLFSHQAAAAGWFEKLTLPRFERRIKIDSASQPIVLQFERQLQWAELMHREMFAILLLLVGATLLVLWLIIRHSLDLDDTVLAHQKMVHLATHDLLTSLPNRTLFADRFDQAIHHWQRSGNQFALLLIDLDFFKEINDRYGHEIGDHVLIACANRMSSQLRACDTVARYGGDEFVILLDNLLNFEDAQGVGEKILAAISEPIESPVGSLSLSCSIGVAICPVHGTSLDVLRKAADQAMYRAKEQGRNALAICPVQIG